MKKFTKVLSLMVAMLLLLTACGGGGNSGTSKEGEGKQESETSTESKGLTFDAAEMIIENEGDPIEGDGAVLYYGIVSDSALEGIFDLNLYTQSNDNVVMSLYNGGNMYSYDESFRLITSDKMEINFDEEARTITYKLNPELTWNDGTPVTSTDLEYAYLVVGSPDYTGVRYDETEDGRIVGIRVPQWRGNYHFWTI